MSEFSDLQKKLEDVVFETHDHYLGKILTIIDASVQGAQGKAIKDLVKREMYDYAQDILGNTQMLAITLKPKEAEDGKPLEITLKSGL